MKKMLGALLTAGILLSTASLSFAEIIPTWEYTVSGTFSSTEYTKGQYGGLQESDTMLTWGESFSILDFLFGTSAPKSSLAINEGSGTTQANQATALTHVNNAINAKYKSLSSGHVSLSLDLSLDGVVNFDPFTFDMRFTFFETPNKGKGAENDDRFIVVSKGFVPNSETRYFNYNGERHALEVSLTFDEFEKDGLTYYGFNTQEGLTSSFDFNWNMYSLSKIDQPTATPEPATMLLMGIGLAGLGFAVRRRQN